MADPFDPRVFAVARAALSDPDVALMQIAERLPAVVRSANAPTPYIPAIPRAFLRTVAAVGDALELLLVALAEMRKRAIDEIAIGPALWRQVGNPSKRVRTRLLRQLGKVPATLCMLTARRGRPHLLVTGPDWPRSTKRHRGNAV